MTSSELSVGVIVSASEHNVTHVASESVRDRVNDFRQTVEIDGGFKLSRLLFTDISALRNAIWSSKCSATLASSSRWFLESILLIEAEERAEDQVVESVARWDRELRAARKMIPVAFSQTLLRTELRFVVEAVSDPALPGNNKCASNCPVIRRSGHSPFSGTARYGEGCGICCESSSSLSPPYVLTA